MPRGSYQRVTDPDAVDRAIEELRVAARTPRFKPGRREPLDDRPRRTVRVDGFDRTYALCPDGIERLIQKVRIPPSDSIATPRKVHNPSSAPGTRIA